MKTIRIKNKGAYVLKAGLGDYATNFQSKVQMINIPVLQSYEFKYPIDSLVAILFLNAAGSTNGNFYVDLINDKRVCIEAWASVFAPKATRIKCD
jgi:hypothetical protein